MAKITEDDLKKILWRDISIQTTEKGHVLILVCETREQSDLLNTMLHKNGFELKISINKNKEYVLSLLFDESDYGIGYNTERTDKDYPPLKWLRNQQVKLITTGIWLENTPQGRKYWYHTTFKELEGVVLN